MKKKYFAVFVVLLSLGCATKSLTIKTGTPATVSLVSSSKLSEDGQRLGDTPLTLNLDKATGRVIKITQNGKLPFFWLVSDAAGDTTVADIKLVDTPASQTSDAKSKDDRVNESRATHNRVLRLLMRSYQALSGNRFNVARELADQAGAIDPQLAAPHVIKGMAFLQEGNREEARAALEKAKALDPEDKDIDTLISRVQQ